MNLATAGTAFAASRSTTWGYDVLGQVNSDSSADRAYQYDAIGNRKKSANSTTLPTDDNYTANALNQYSTIATSSASPNYDDDGNATAYPLPVNPSTNATLTWDAENRLTSATVNGVNTTYAYDAQSRRIAKTSTINNQQSAIYYLYDGWNVIAEYSRSVGVPPTLSKTYLWGLDLSGTLQGAGGVGGLLAVQIQNPQSSIYYPTYDGNGNISEYIGSDGTIAAHFEYDPFGNTVVNTDTAGLFNYRFSTKPLDAETGLYYYGYRFYDPVTGRWPSRDPIWEKGGKNLYEFVGNDVVNKWDVLGCKTGISIAAVITWITDRMVESMKDCKGGCKNGIDQTQNCVDCCNGYAAAAQLTLAAAVLTADADCLVNSGGSPGAYAVCAIIVGYGDKKGADEIKSAQDTCNDKCIQEGSR
jgi:RHS repeat-associated protein